MPSSSSSSHFLLIFILASFHYLTPSSGSVSEICPEIEKQALLSFKLHMNDPGGLMSSWKPQVDCCMWQNVVCSNSTGHVLELHLQNPGWVFEGMNGTLDDSLLNLSHLRYLDLSRNRFEGAIPAFIGSFSNLEYLNLSQVRFNGTLDDSLLNLTHLRYLDLSWTLFEGAIPASIESFSNLEYLDLSNAGFGGMIPHTIGNLSRLTTLVLGGGDSEYEADSLEWMSGLSYLEHLELKSMNLSRATDWLPVLNTLPSLADLTLSSTKIPYSFLPLSEVNFSSLIKLHLSYIDFLVFPNWILQINKLTHLQLYHITYSSGTPNRASNLTNLQHLQISFSLDFTSIPDWILGCKSLQYFDMYGCSLQGSIPSAIGNLTSLEHLDLSYNQLSGEIPSEITKLCNIRHINLSNNMLHGNVSHTFRNMSNCFLESLEFLDLSENQLIGHLIDQFGEFTSLSSLNLGRNNLSGSIPGSVGKLFSLTELQLEDNKFRGYIPESMGQLSNLVTLSLDDNMFQGVVGENHFASLKKLTSFTASRNNLTLKVGTSWVPPFRVSVLKLQSWNLSGGAKIPAWLDVQRGHLGELDLSNTGIAHQFASWFWEIPNLNLSHNQLHGGIPDSISHSDYYSARSMYLGNNLFNGSLPRINRELDALDLSNNLFSGGLNHFLCDESGYEFDLQILNLMGNLMSGEIPDCWMKWRSIKLLNLGNNTLSGHIPDSIGLLVNMWSLDLNNNKLVGRIPTSLRNCIELAKIDLAYNLLTGNLPMPLGEHLPRLGILIIRSNMLSGRISLDVCKLVSLQILDFSSNMFYGIIPSCVERFFPMVSKQWSLDDYIDMADVDTLGYVTSFDLSNNNLSGKIPEQLTRLVQLRSLNLSGNQLGGIIPHGIGDMKELQSLDLSRNSLTGDIPETLANLTLLSYLNVSYNNLSGRIPQSMTRITNLLPSGFIGNQLCGLPLPIRCNDDGVTSTTRNQGYTEDGKSEVEWLYVFSALGYVVGLGAVFNALIFKKEWRYAFFGLVDNLWNKIYVYISIKLNRYRWYFLVCSIFIYSLCNTMYEQ